MEHSYRINLGMYALRPLAQSDIEALRALRNASRNCFLHNAVITEQQQLNWYQRYLVREGDYMFALTQSTDNAAFLGAVALYGVTRQKGTAESGRILVDKTAAPQRGVGTAALRGICTFGFRDLKLLQITAEILPENTASIRIHEKAGYRLIHKTGQCLQYALAYQQFRAQYPELLQEEL